MVSGSIASKVPTNRMSVSREKASSLAPKDGVRWRRRPTRKEKRCSRIVPGITHRERISTGFVPRCSPSRPPSPQRPVSDAPQKIGHRREGSRLGRPKYSRSGLGSAELRCFGSLGCAGRASFFAKGSDGGVPMSLFMRLPNTEIQKGDPKSQGIGPRTQT
jgi:hypothetical protein